MPTRSETITGALADAAEMAAKVDTARTTLARLTSCDPTLTLRISILEQNKQPMQFDFPSTERGVAAAMAEFLDDAIGIFEKQARDAMAVAVDQFATFIPPPRPPEPEPEPPADPDADTGEERLVFEGNTIEGNEGEGIHHGDS